jgi:ribosomal protein L37AE/L43A
MKSNRKQNKSGQNQNEQAQQEEDLRMELKYCERCGGLWLRQCGAGVVYCANCEREVADLPVPKKKPQRVRVPVLPHSVAENYRYGGRENRFGETFDQNGQGDDFHNDNDGGDLDAAGGAA